MAATSGECWAVWVCFCRKPPNYLCPACLPQHLLFEGVHEVASLKEKQLCNLCHTSLAGQIPPQAPHSHESTLQDLKEQMVESVREELKQHSNSLREVVRAEIRRALNIVPLVTFADSEWLDRESVESFFGLASLGLNEEVREEDMRQIARTCSLLVRMAAPCQYIADFVNILTRRLRGNPQQVISLTQQLEQARQLLQKVSDPKPILQRLLSLAASGALDDALTLFLRLGLRLDLTSVLDYLAEDSVDCAKWRAVLLVLSTEWRQDICELFRLLADRKFDGAALALAQLPLAYSSPCPSHVLAFAELALRLLQAQTTALSMGRLLLLLPKDRTSLDQALIVLQLVRNDSTPQELRQIEQLLEGCGSSQSLFEATRLLVEGFTDKFQDKKLRVIVFAAIDWLLPDRTPREDASFAVELLGAFKGVEAVLLLSELAKSGSNGALERAFSFMILKLQGPKVLTLMRQLTQLTKTINSSVPDFMTSWVQLLETANAERVADRVSELLSAGNDKIALYTVVCFSKVLQLGKETATAFAWSALAAADQEMLTFLQYLAVTLKSPQQALALQVLQLWLQCRQFRPERSTVLCTYVLAHLKDEGMEEMLGEITQTLTSSPITVLDLAELYRQHGFSARDMCEWLQVIRELIGTDSLTQLLPQLRLSREILKIYISAALALCRSRPGIATELSCALGRALAQKEATQLLTDLAAISDAAARVLLLGVAVQDLSQLNQLVRKTSCINSPPLWEQIKCVLVLPGTLDYVLQTLLLVRANSKPPDLERVAVLLSFLRPGKLCTSAKLLIRAFRDEEKVLGLAAGTLEWLQSGGDSDTMEAFVQALLPLLDRTDGRERITTLLSALAKLSADFKADLEQAYCTMLPKLSADKAQALTMQLALSGEVQGEQLKDLLKLVKSSQASSSLVDTVCSWLQGAASLLLRCLRCFATLVRCGSEFPVVFISEVMRVLEQSQSDPTLPDLLDALVERLEAGQQEYAVALKIPPLWILRRQVGEPVTLFCLSVLQQPSRADLSELIEKMDWAFAQPDINYAAALQLTEIYVTRIVPASLIGQWLETLKGLQAESLEVIFSRVKDIITATEVEGFLEATLALCTNEQMQGVKLSVDLCALLLTVQTLPLLASEKARAHPAFVTLLKLQLILEQNGAHLPRLDNVLKEEYAHELSALIAGCLELAESSLAELVGILLAVVETQPGQVGLLRLLPVLAMKLLRSKVSLETVSKLGVELLVCMEEIDKRKVVERVLRVDYEQVESQLVEILSKQYLFTNLEKLLWRFSHIAQVTKTFLQWFDTESECWGEQHALLGAMQADNYSSWIVLDDTSVFCSGGED